MDLHEAGRKAGEEAVRQRTISLSDLNKAIDATIKHVRGSVAWDYDHATVVAASAVATALENLKFELNEEGG